MRITRRTSGGRGEYEISEECSGTTPHDLVGHRITLTLDSRLSLDTATELRAQGGKLRLRRLGTTGIQVQRQMAAALLMPHPVRADNSLGTGSPVMRRNQYAIDHLHVTGVSLTSGTATLQMGTLTLRNQMFQAEEVTVRARLGTLRRVWANKARLPDGIANLLDQHEARVTTHGSSNSAVEKTVEKLEALVSESAEDLDIPYNEGADVLPALAEALDLVRPEPVVQLDEVDPEEPELRRRVIREWRRWGRSRGAASAKFREAVRTAYNSTCAVCGKHFPPTTKSRTPGVDAAHILPWADYDLDEVSNGICLCKSHHWAFDEGLIRIRFEDGEYLIEVPKDIREAIAKEHPKFSIASLRKYAGRLAIGRLPNDPGSRPNPSLLQHFNEELDKA